MTQTATIEAHSLTHSRSFGTAPFKAMDAIDRAEADAQHNTASGQQQQQLQPQQQQADQVGTGAQGNQVLPQDQAASNDNTNNDNGAIDNAVDAPDDNSQGQNTNAPAHLALIPLHPTGKKLQKLEAKPIPIVLGRTNLANWWWKSCDCGDYCRLHCRPVAQNIRSLSKVMVQIDSNGVLYTVGKNPHLATVTPPRKNEPLQVNDIIAIGRRDREPWMRFQVISGTEYESNLSERARNRPRAPTPAAAASARATSKGNAEQRRGDKVQQQQPAQYTEPTIAAPQAAGGQRLPEWITMTRRVPVAASNLDADSTGFNPNANTTANGNRGGEGQRSSITQQQQQQMLQMLQMPQAHTENQHQQSQQHQHEQQEQQQLRAAAVKPLEETLAAAAAASASQPLPPPAPVQVPQQLPVVAAVPPTLAATAPVYGVGTLNQFHHEAEQPSSRKRRRSRHSPGRRIKESALVTAKRSLRGDKLSSSKAKSSLHLGSSAPFGLADKDHYPQVHLLFQDYETSAALVRATQRKKRRKSPVAGDTSTADAMSASNQSSASATGRSHHQRRLPRQFIGNKNELQLLSQNYAAALYNAAQAPDAQNQNNDLNAALTTVPEAAQPEAAAEAATETGGIALPQPQGDKMDAEMPGGQQSQSQSNMGAQAAVMESNQTPAAKEGAESIPGRGECLQNGAPASALAQGDPTTRRVIQPDAVEANGIGVDVDSNVDVSAPNDAGPSKAQDSGQADGTVSKATAAADGVALRDADQDGTPLTVSTAANLLSMPTANHRTGVACNDQDTNLDESHPAANPAAHPPSSVLLNATPITVAPTSTPHGRQTTTTTTTIYFDASTSNSEMPPDHPGIPTSASQTNRTSKHDSDSSPELVDPIQNDDGQWERHRR